MLCVRRIYSWPFTPLPLLFMSSHAFLPLVGFSFSQPAGAAERLGVLNRGEIRELIYGGAFDWSPLPRLFVSRLGGWSQQARRFCIYRPKYLSLTIGVTVTIPMTVGAKRLFGLNQAERYHDLLPEVDWGCEYAAPGEYYIPYGNYKDLC